MSKITSITAVLALSICCCHLVVAQQLGHGRGHPLWELYNTAVVVRTYYGDVRGFSVPWDIEDTVWNRELFEYPPWFMRRVNCFLGIPYALPPTGYLRFQRPHKPRWLGTYEANYFRPACPQRLDSLRADIPDYPKANISEDCLYMNIYAPNVSTHSRETLYPVMVWIHGGNYTFGSAQQIPGQVLATREVVVVTFNYRLGALGFLSTENEYATGNWGLWDQHLALEFVKENIKAFRGDPNRITLCGEGAGAASVGMHLLSPMSRGKGFYHQAIMMSGSDLSSMAYIRPTWRPREYAVRLAKLLDCPTHHSYDLIMCLRDDTKHDWQEFVDSQEFVYPHDGVLGMVWAPVQDSSYHANSPFLPETPYELRRSHEFEKVPIIIGLNTEDGAQKANDTVRGLEGGMLGETFKTYVERLVEDWLVQKEYRSRAYEAIEFQYTYWPDPENSSARTQEFINMLTDLQVGVGMDQVIKLHSLYEPTYVYQFNYKSWNDWLPRWLGVSYSAALPYVFGFPYLNETVVNETELIPRQYFDYEDRNISDWMMYLFTNFAKYGEPTPNNTWNVTWGPFNEYNLSYLIVDWYPHLGLRYRQSKYGFWSDYFPSISIRDQFSPTATPTPSGYEYVIATGSMSATVIVLFIILFILIYILVVHPRRFGRKDSYYDDVPVSFNQSQSTIYLSKSSSSIQQHSVV